MYFACASRVALDWQGVWQEFCPLRSGVIRAAIGQGQKAESLKAEG